jgi:hypothetical protein
MCPHCGSKLKRSHTTCNKKIFTLKQQTLHIISHAYKCTNQKNCPKPKELYKSKEPEKICLKHYQYSIEVIVKIGHLYYNKHQTLNQIKQHLKKLDISKSEINLLCQAYLALNKADHEQNHQYLNKIKPEGIILELDGVQPEKGNETLWILKDNTTKTTLLAKNLASADKNSLATLLKEVKTLNIKINAVISDGQRSIRLAVKQELPNIPHQLCHYHFLRNIAKPVSEMDRALKVDLKKKVRGIKPIEQKTIDSQDKQKQLIYKYCQTIRFALQDDGRYPLKPGGLQLYSRLQTIQQSIERNNKLRPNAELQKILCLLSILDELKSRYQKIKRLYKWIFRANRILRQNKSKKHKKSSARVEADLFLFFDDLLKVYCKCSKEDGLVFENILKFMASYWEGLFFHYDMSLVPRTNNDLERFICRLKSGFRKTVGRASCQGFIVRYGAFVVLLDDSLSQEELVVRFGSVGYGVFRRWFGEIRGFRVRLHLRRCLSKGFCGSISGLEREWAALVL